MTDDASSHSQGTTRPRPGNQDRLDALLAEAFGAAGATADDRAQAILEREGGAWTRVLLRAAAPEAAPVVQRPAEDAPREPLLVHRYRVEGEIARGGVGVVLKAYDRTLARDVAVKVLRTRHQDTPWMAERFLEEAQIGAQLEHPGIVPVHDVGLLDDRRPFFTMKLVQGRTLAALLAERPSPQDQRARFLTLFERVCQTLAYAHARGVIHRDLKPSNVMVGAFGEVQVTDWGMAKVLRQGGTADEARAERATAPPPVPVATVRSESGSSSASVAGSVFGTPGYMAPEQARGEVLALTERTDVFALGAVLCEILTGPPPFRGDREEALLLAQQGNTCAALAAIDACGADTEVVALARQCLAADPLARPASARVVADGMARYLATVEERVRAAELSAARATARAAAERNARRLAVVLLMVVVAAVAAGVGAVTWLERERDGRQGRTARAVDEAIAEGRQLWPAAGVADAHAWQAVEASAHRASTLAESTDADSATAARARGFGVEVEHAAGAARVRAQQDAEDQRLRERLDAIRGMPALDFDWERQNREYAALFAELGFEPTAAGVAHAASRLRNHRVAGELAMALDEWRVCRTNLSQDPSTWESITALASAIDRDPLRGRARALGDKPDADQARRLVAEADPEHAPVRTIELLARTLRAAGDREAALGVLRLGQASYPGDFWLAMRLAQETLTPGDRTESIRHASAALAIKPRSLYAGVWLSTQLAESGGYEQAVAFMRPLLAHHPDSRNLRHNLGTALWKLGRCEEAISHLERAIELDPTDFKAPYTLGHVLRKLGRNDASRRCFERAVELAPDSEPALVSLGMSVSDDLQDHERARALFARAVAASPEDPDPRFFLGIMLEKLGRTDKALVEWRACVAVAPGELRAWERIARLELAAQHPVQVQEAAERALAVNPDLGWAHYMLGNLRSDQGDRDGAIAEWRAAVKVKPDMGEAWHNLGWELVEDPTTLVEAVEAFRRAVAAWPESIASRCELARALLMAERLDEAASEARGVLGREAGNERAQKVLREVERRRRKK